MSGMPAAGIFSLSAVESFAIAYLLIWRAA
jgi:hypothetical protein